METALKGTHADLLSPSANAEGADWKVPGALSGMPSCPSTPLVPHWAPVPVPQSKAVGLPACPRRSSGSHQAPALAPPTAKALVTSKPWEKPQPNFSAISNPLYLFVDPNDTLQGKDPGTLQEKPQPILILAPTLPEEPLDICRLHT